MKLHFFKLDGAGNDFVVIDNRRRTVARRSALARKLCDRHRGIGADGLLLVERSWKAHYRMMYYNADGSYGGMCGNGGRCIAMYAYLTKIAGRNHRFEALGHIYEAKIQGEATVKLSMKDPVGIRTGIQLRGPFGPLKAHFVDTGSPHAVLAVKKGTIEKIDVTTIGRWVRGHHAFRPQGTNVNFVEVVGPKSLRVRTYERGVEAETLACGTGSVACSVMASVTLGMTSPVTVHASSGEHLRVSFRLTDLGYSDIVLEGPANVSFRGSVHV